MAVAKGRVPEGAIILTETEAIQKQLQFVDDWKPASDVFFLKNSMTLTAAATVPFTVYFVDAMRTAMKVGKHGLFASYLASIVMPAFVAGAAHYKWVTRDVVIRKTECSSCIGIRSGFIQSLLGSIYPTVIIPLGVATFATRLESVNLPEKTKHIASGVSKLFRPHRSFLLANFVLQFAVGFLVSELETSDIMTISSRFAQMQSDIEMTSES